MAAENLEKHVSEALPAIHAFIRCDITIRFVNKKTSSGHSTLRLSRFEDSEMPSQQLLDVEQVFKYLFGQQIGKLRLVYMPQQIGFGVNMTKMTLDAGTQVYFLKMAKYKRFKYIIPTI